MKRIFTVVIMGLGLLSAPAFADDDNATTACPDAVSAAVDMEFGAGSSGVTRCLARRNNVKVVYQINQLCKDAACTKPYAIGNIKNAIKDYEDTHDMVRGVDYEIVAIVHSAGWKQVLDDATVNPFRDDMLDLLAMGVKIKFCQNTARKKGVKYDDLIDGIEFTTSGVTAIADYQLLGYAFVQP